MKIKVREFKQWIAALDSGEYTQGKGLLQDENNKGYCCLGVACITLIPKELLNFNKNSTEIFGAFPDDQKKAPSWLKKINDDFKEKTGMYLSGLNDSGQYSFGELATLLELVYIHKMLD